MKLKNNKIFIFFLGFLIGGIMFGSIGIYAATLSFDSGDVDHTKSDNTKTTVEAALNELYSKANAGKTIIDLGTAKSFDLTSYEGYQNFTVDDFIIAASSGSYSQSQNMGGQNTVQNITPSASYSASISKSYNQSTGILTVSRTVSISASCSMYRDGTFSKSTPAKTVTEAVHVYLIK